MRTRDRASKGDKKWKRDASYLLRSGRHSIYWDERERERGKIEKEGWKFKRLLRCAQPSFFNGRSSEFIVFLIEFKRAAKTCREKRIKYETIEPRGSLRIELS